MNNINKEYSLETRRKRMIEAQNRPDVKRRKSISGIIAQNRPDVKERKSKAFRGKKLIDRHKIDCVCSFCKRRRGQREPEETRKKRSDALKGRISPRKGVVLSEGVKRKMSVAKKGKKTAESTKRKLRESAFNYAKKSSNIICPRIGKNEKKILDDLEKQFEYEIDRRFTIEGFFPDGYIHELNLIIEVDERLKNREKDVERERIIKEALNCEFLRIKDYVYRN